MCRESQDSISDSSATLVATLPQIEATPLITRPRTTQQPLVLRVYMTQKQKHTLSMWNLRRSADRTHPHTLSLPTDLTMWSHTIPQLQSLLPAARHLDCTGPSSAPFLHEALRNGVDDVNLINAAIWVLEWRFKVSLSDATSYDRELLEEAETKFQKISQSLDHLLTLYLELISFQDHTQRHNWTYPTSHIQKRQFRQ